MRQLRFPISIGALVCGLATAAVADDFTLFGISDPEVEQEFLNEAEDIANSASTGEIMNSITPELSPAELLQDAFRTDPEATLDLIERMLRAGQTQ